MDRVIAWQKFEGAAIFITGLWLFVHNPSGITWWAAVLIFFAPDLGFAGYLLGPKPGAFVYNLLHVYAFGAVFILLGTVLGALLLASLGALWLAHSGFDRMLGYGLKSTQGFGFTHLGRIGKSS